MALPHHYLAALITPTGRLNQFGFAILSIVLAFAHVWVYAQVRKGHGLDIWGPHTIALFVMIWMMFCIMSRRMHDTGAAGFILVPLLIFAVAMLLVGIDRSILGPNLSNHAVGDLVIQHGVKAVRTLAIASFLYLIRAGSEDGDNAYGPEFGDGSMFGGTSTQRSGHDALDDIERGQLAKHNFRRVNTSSAPNWGERRQQKGFGRR